MIACVHNQTHHQFDYCLATGVITASGFWGSGSQNGDLRIHGVSIYLDKSFKVSNKKHMEMRRQQFVMLTQCLTQSQLVLAYQEILASLYPNMFKRKCQMQRCKLFVEMFDKTFHCLYWYFSKCFEPRLPRLHYLYLDWWWMKIMQPMPRRVVLF